MDFHHCPVILLIKCLRIIKTVFSKFFYRVRIIINSLIFHCFALGLLKFWVIGTWVLLPVVYLHINKVNSKISSKWNSLYAMEKKIHFSSVYPRPEVQITTQSLMVAPKGDFPKVCTISHVSALLQCLSKNILSWTSIGWHSRCNH